MTHILASTQDNGDLMYFENLQEVVTMAIPHVAFALGADEAKRFEADVAKCINGSGDVVSRCTRLEKTYQVMSTLMLGYLEEQAEVTRRLQQQLQAYSGCDGEQGGAWSTENLSEDAKQKALVLVHALNTQYARHLEASNNYLVLSMHFAKFSEKERTFHESAMQKLASLADSTKASMDAANEASARSESALRNANKKIMWTFQLFIKLSAAVENTKAAVSVAQLEKDACGTGERIAHVVRDLQKLAYEKDDPG